MEQISDYRNSLNLIYELNEKIKETSYYWVQKWIQNNMPKYNDSFLDSVSQGQYDSKKWLKDELIKVKKYLKRYEPLHIDIIGSWFGFPLIEFVSEIFKIKQIDLYDSNEDCHKIMAQYIKHYDYDFKIVQFGNFFDRKELRRRHLIINTSSEHMSDIILMKEYYKDYPEKPIIVIQSNNYYEIQDHVNCVSSENQLIDKNHLKEIYFSGKQSLPLYDRYMVLGRW